MGENLRSSLAQLPLTKSLVTIKLDVDLGIDFSDLKIKTADKKTLIELYKEMEFKTWLAELLETTKENNHTDKYANYLIIKTESAFNEFIAQLNAAKIFAFGIQTTSLDYMDTKLVGLSFALEPGKGVYIPFGHDYPGAPTQLSQEFIFASLKSIIENPEIKKIGQNVKYTMEVLANNGIYLQGAAFDTMIESYILDSVSNSHLIDSLALKYLGLRTISYEDIAGKGNKQVPFNAIDVQKAGFYAAEEADVTLQLHHLLWPRINQEPGLKTVVEKIEMPLIPVLATMERTGVLIDPVMLEKHGKVMQNRLDELEQEAFQLAGKKFNINSPKQLQEILFQHLQLPILQKTPTGQASTADPVLEELALDFALPRIIIEYRSLSKLISTYTNRLVEQIDAKSGRIHTFYNQSGTATGRLSSSEPNLQNIPIRSPEGRRIRQSFVAQADENH